MKNLKVDFIFILAMIFVGLMANMFVNWFRGDGEYTVTEKLAVCMDNSQIEKPVEGFEYYKEYEVKRTKVKSSIPLMYNTKVDTLSSKIYPKKKK